MALAFFAFIWPMRSARNETIYFGTSSYTMISLLVSRVIYSHYVLWVSVSAFPALYLLYKDGKIKEDSIRSVYKPWPAKIRRGVGPPDLPIPEENN